MSAESALFTRNLIWCPELTVAENIFMEYKLQSAKKSDSKTKKRQTHFYEKYKVPA